MTAVGEQLRAAREAQDLSIADVAERTRVPSRHLAAIETGEHGALPAATYSSGFVKTYARLLGLDGQTLSQQFRTELAETAPRSAFHEVYEPADPARTPPRSVAWISLAVAVLAILGYLYWRGATAEDPVTVAAIGSDVTAPPRPLPAARPQAAAATAPATRVTLTAESAVWLRISQPGSGNLYQGILQPAQSFSIPATATDPRLLTSRPNALKVTVGATAIPSLGAPEQRIKDVSLKPDALLARVTPSPPGGAGL